MTLEVIIKNNMTDAEILQSFKTAGAITIYGKTFINQVVAEKVFDEQIAKERALRKADLRIAFGAGMYRATFNGRPGYEDAPDFDEWYKSNYEDTERVEP
jgi:hypothetical protein